MAIASREHLTAAAICNVRNLTTSADSSYSAPTSIVEPGRNSSIETHLFPATLTRSCSGSTACCCSTEFVPLVLVTWTTGDPVKYDANTRGLLTLAPCSWSCSDLPPAWLLCRQGTRSQRGKEQACVPEYRETGSSVSVSLSLVCPSYKSDRRNCALDLKLLSLPAPPPCPGMPLHALPERSSRCIFPPAQTPWLPPPASASIQLLVVRAAWKMCLFRWVPRLLQQIGCLRPRPLKLAAALLHRTWVPSPCDFGRRLGRCLFFFFSA